MSYIQQECSLQCKQYENICRVSSVSVCDDVDLAMDELLQSGVVMIMLAEILYGLFLGGFFRQKDIWDW